MKVTTLIPDYLIEEVRHISKGETITESLLIALKEWLSFKRLATLNQKIQKKPLKFQKGFTSQKVRTLNRKS